MIRKRIERSMLIFALALGGCGDDAGGTEEEVETENAIDEEAAAETAAAFNPAALLSNIMGQLGGATMVAGNNLVVEVLPNASGDVQGLVYDAEGNVVQNAKLTVTAKGADGSSKPVELEWNAEAEVYVGTVAEADTEAEVLATGPMEVSVEVEGEDEPATGEAEVVAVARTPVYGGDVFVAGDLSAEMVALPSGDIQLIAYGPDGLLTGAAADLKVEVPDAEGEGHEVDLVWNADASAYLGSVEEGVTLDTGAITFSATRNGTLRRSRVARAPIRVPTHEGDVVVVGGGMTAELVPKEDGRIHAYVVDRDGNTVEADADASVSFAFGGAIDPIPAEWDADAGAYVAVVPPEVDVSATPMRVRVRRAGRVHRGAIAVPAGRALGVGWRARVEAGEGGAIPPGQARAVLAGPDIRARIRGNAVAGGRTVMVGGMGAGMGPSAAAMVNADVAERVRGAAARAQGAAVMVNVRAPMVDVRAPMVSVMTSGGGMSSAMATTRRRRGGGSAGGSVMAGVMVSFGN